MFTGTTISLFGSSVTTVALPLTAVVYLHASPAQMGLLGAMSLLPHLVLGLPAGVWVQRIAYRRKLVVSDLARFPLLACGPALALFGMLQVWHLYLVALLAGVGNLLETVAAQSFIPVVVPRRQLLPANSSLMLINSTVNTTGSALAGFLVSLLTAPIALAVDAVSFLVSGLVKTRIRAGDTAAGGTVAGASHSGQRMLPGIVEGLRAVFAHRIIRAVTLAAAIGALAGQMQGVILVLYLVRDLAFSPALVGIVIAATGAAGILAAGAATRLTRRLGHGRTFIAGMLLSSLAGLILSAAGGGPVMTLATALLAQAAAGIGPSLYGVNQQTLRQALISPGLLSRANATWRFLVHGVRALGAALGGLVASTVDLRTTLIIGSGLMLVGTAVAWASPLHATHDLPEHDDPATAPRPASPDLTQAHAKPQKA